jgi:hypothetical protein
MPLNLLTQREIDARMRRYDEALRAYVPVARVEEMSLPALRLQNVLTGLDASVSKLLAIWSQR